MVLEENGHFWVGADISPAMLDIAIQREFENGDVILNDLGQGLPFRPGMWINSTWIIFREEPSKTLISND